MIRGDTTHQGRRNAHDEVIFEVRYGTTRFIEVQDKYHLTYAKPVLSIKTLLVLLYDRLLNAPPDGLDLHLQYRNVTV